MHLETTKAAADVGMVGCLRNMQSNARPAAAASGAFFVLLTASAHNATSS